MKPAYYSEVVEDLLRYREYKYRVLMIAEKADENLLQGMGIDYSRPSVQSSNLFDSTAQTVMNRLDDRLAEEFKEKVALVKRVEIAYRGLDPIEQFVIHEKYMSGRKEFDVNIYTDPKFSKSKVKYYEIKDAAVAKLARIMGYN